MKINLCTVQIFNICLKLVAILIQRSGGRLSGSVLRSACVCRPTRSEFGAERTGSSASSLPSSPSPPVPESSRRTGSLAGPSTLS